MGAWARAHRFRPQTHGKVEIYRRTLRINGVRQRLRELNSAQHTLNLWLHIYNDHGSDTLLVDQPPSSCVTNLPEQNI